MLYYDRIDISKGITLVKSNSSKEWMICHYWYFNHGFEFQDYECNGCHDLVMLSVNIINIAIITVKNVDYRCIIHNISKSEAINLLQKFCSWRSRVYIRNIPLNLNLFKAGFFYFFLFSMYEMVDSMNIYQSLYISIGTVMKN